MTPPEHYVGSDLDGFLNSAMQRLNRLTDRQRNQLAEAFRVAMLRARVLFANDAFRKRFSAHQSRSPINRALFEAWSVALAHLSEADFEQLKDRAGLLRERFSDALLEFDEFLSSISASTGDRARVLARFNTVEKIIRGTLNA
jgi:hypothetical protein